MSDELDYYALALCVWYEEQDWKVEFNKNLSAKQVAEIITAVTAAGSPREQG